MTLIQPNPTDTLAAGNHALMHKVVSVDSVAPVESINVASTGYVGIGTTTPQAQLDINTTLSAFLPPRMTSAQKNALTGLVEGMEIYDTNLHALCFYNGTTWKTVATL